jgi:hypothetical protein
MSTAPPSNDRDTEPIRIGERKRAALVLGVIAVVAVALVLIMVYFLGGSDNDPSPLPVGEPTGPAVIATGQPSQHASPTTARPSSRASRHTHTPAPTQQGPVSCPTNQPCALPGDVGNAVAALNRYRTAHGRDPVNGSVTKAARVCALSSGDNCPSDYFWQPVGRSGKQVISKIAAARDGTSWLLDRTMTAVQVGWAYLPSSHSFECALIAKH